MTSTAIIAVPLALNAGTEFSMKSIEISHCSPDGLTCMTVRAPTAQIGSVRPIFFLKNVQIEIVEAKVQRKIAYQKPQGYLDFDSNQLVLQSQDKSGALTEEVYNLKTLQKQVFVTR